MTFKVLKSVASRIHNFDAAVQAHSYEMKQWRAHMERVRKDAGDPSIPPEHKHAAYPAPHAHEIIASSVDENDLPAYEIINDDLSAEETLSRKKAEFLAEAARAEALELVAVNPPGKRRLNNLRETDIRAADQQRYAEAVEKNKGLMKSLGFVSRVDVYAEVERARDPDDTAHIRSQDVIRRKEEEIHRRYAKIMSGIEDLTVDNFGEWKLP